MSEETVEIQEYLLSHMPRVVGRFLEEKPLPDMEGTVFTLRVAVKGEVGLTFGITVKDAKEITVHPEGLQSPMLSVEVSEDVFRHVTRQVARFVSRKQYDGVVEAKGTLRVEMEMPGGWVLPVTLTFNGAEQPSASIRGPAEVLARVVSGQLSGPEAFMQGKIKMDGDIVFLLSLAKFL